MDRIAAEWLSALNDEDMQFLKRFLLVSGSLKALAEEYGVSYPTVRARLDRLIAKVTEVERTPNADPMERKIRLLVADGKVDASVGRDLLAVYRRTRRKEE